MGPGPTILPQSLALPSQSYAPSPRRNPRSTSPTAGPRRQGRRRRQPPTTGRAPPRARPVHTLHTSCPPHRCRSTPRAPPRQALAAGLASENQRRGDQREVAWQEERRHTYLRQLLQSSGSGPSPSPSTSPAASAGTTASCGPHSMPPPTYQVSAF